MERRRRFRRAHLISSHALCASKPTAHLERDTTPACRGHPNSEFEGTSCLKPQRVMHDGSTSVSSSTQSVIGMCSYNLGFGRTSASPKKKALNCQKRVHKSHLRIIGPRSSIYVSQNMGNKRRRGLVFAHCSEALVLLMTCESRVLDLARFWQASTGWRLASKPSTANALTTRALALHSCRRS